MHHRVFFVSTHCFDVFRRSEYTSFLSLIDIVWTCSLLIICSLGGLFPSSTAKAKKLQLILVFEILITNLQQCPCRLVLHSNYFLCAFVLLQMVYVLTVYNKRDKQHCIRVPNPFMPFRIPLIIHLIIKISLFITALPIKLSNYCYCNWSWKATKLLLHYLSLLYD